MSGCSYIICFVAKILNLGVASCQDALLDAIIKETVVLRANNNSCTEKGTHLLLPRVLKF